MKELEGNPSHTQRALARKLDVSLGKMNYVIAGLVEKGLIKARKLRNHPDRIRWQYILTPKGMKEKVRITRRYLSDRLREFDALQEEIRSLKHEVEELGDGSR